METGYGYSNVRLFVSTTCLIKQGYAAPRLKSLLKIYGRHHQLVDRYEISISHTAIDLPLLCRCVSFLYHRLGGAL